MIRAEIAVESATLTPEKITSAVGLRPDSVRVKGEPSSVPGRENQANIWTMKIHTSGEYFGGEEGLSAAVLSLGTPVAERLKMLSEEGAIVVLAIVQDISDPADRISLGIGLTPAAIEWLARSGASLDIDQYFDVFGRSPDRPDELLGDV